MIKTSSRTNSIIASCSAYEYSHWFGDAKQVSLTASEILHEAHSNVTHVYFPHAGLILLLVVLANGRTVEAGFVGAEGAAGTLFSPISHLSFTRSQVVSAGSALRIPVEQFELAVNQSARVRDQINENNFLITARAQQTAACNLLHELEPRLCRWLLQIFENSGKFDRQYYPS